MSRKKEVRNKGVLKLFKKTGNLSEVALEYNLAVSTVHEIVYRKRSKKPLEVSVS